MVIDFFQMFELSDYMLLIAAGILICLYILYLIKVYKTSKYIIKPKRESDAFISTIGYKLKDNNYYTKNGIKRKNSINAS